MHSKRNLKRAVNDWAVHRCDICLTHIPSECRPPSATTAGGALHPKPAPLELEVLERSQATVEHACHCPHVRLIPYLLLGVQQPRLTRGLPTAGRVLRAEQSLPTAGSYTTKQDCIVLLPEMKFDHQDQTQACCPPMPGTRHHMFRPMCGRIASLTLCTLPSS